ncbi:MAG: GNAT family N-acetyltransferase [Gammaproteobacteria bacterium]|nr:GNAT family N-acetyltransferase [Gammaproteobacteria bacterium]NNC98275.1 GNAT family N-acetyltransferase [Gammaproteobacteria bacterium]NNM14643.1 GNAT family N-acetyltransferase [Gammaproteobacteria bacterium]
MSDSQVIFRKATLPDVPELMALIACASRALSAADYSNTQIEAAIGTVWGVDEELIRDQTFIVATILQDEVEKIVGCGGWSKRAKLFGASEGNESSPLLDPQNDASRIRAFFVHPEWSRQGIGREIIRICEHEARQAGFTKMELMATLPGYRLYRSCGYLGDEITPCGSNEFNTHDCVPMWKSLI